MSSVFNSLRSNRSGRFAVSCSLYTTAEQVRRASSAMSSDVCRVCTMSLVIDSSRRILRARTRCSSHRERTFAAVRVRHCTNTSALASVITRSRLGFVAGRDMPADFEIHQNDSFGLVLHSVQTSIRSETSLKNRPTKNPAFFAK